MKWEGVGSASFATLLVNQILVLPLNEPLLDHREKAHPETNEWFK